LETTKEDTNYQVKWAHNYLVENTRRTIRDIKVVTPTRKCAIKKRRVKMTPKLGEPSK
jgi:hypothetical protein